MRYFALALLLMSGVSALGEDRPQGKRHEYRGDVDLAAPPDAKPDWRPSARVKVNDSVAILYKTPIQNVEIFECTSDSSDVRVSLSTDEKGTGLRVGVRSGGKKASAKVTWVIHDLYGGTHHGRMDVVFE